MPNKQQMNNKWIAELFKTKGLNGWTAIKEIFKQMRLISWMALQIFFNQWGGLAKQLKKFLNG